MNKLKAAFYIFMLLLVTAISKQSDSIIIEIVSVILGGTAVAAFIAKDISRNNKIILLSISIIGLILVLAYLGYMHNLKLGSS